MSKAAAFFKSEEGPRAQKILKDFCIMGFFVIWGGNVKPRIVI